METPAVGADVASAPALAILTADGRVLESGRVGMSRGELSMIASDDTDDPDDDSATHPLPQSCRTLPGPDRHYILSGRHDHGIRSGVRPAMDAGRLPRALRLPGMRLPPASPRVPARRRLLATRRSALTGSPRTHSPHLCLTQRSGWSRSAPGGRGAPAPGAPRREPRRTPEPAARVVRRLGSAGTAGPPWRRTSPRRAP